MNLFEMRPKKNTRINGAAVLHSNRFELKCLKNTLIRETKNVLIEVKMKCQ